MLTYNEILDIILLEAGQWLIGLEATMIKPSQMEILIKRELAFYSRYFPREMSKTARLYNGYIFTKEVNGEIPQKIISIKNVSNDSFITSTIYPNFSARPRAIPASSWSYKKPELYLKFPSNYYTYSYIVAHEYVHDDNTDKCGIDSLTLSDTYFLNLLIGKFLMTIGRSRRAFVINDLPFNMDSEQLYNEGKELYDNAVQIIQTNSSFQLAIIV